MSVAPTRSLQASALSFLLLSIGHTISGRQWTAEKAFKAISNSKPWACGTVGWYQVTSLLHYQWSRDPTALNDPVNKAMAGIINILLWASSAWYAKNGIKDIAIVVGMSAALQTYAVFEL
ncbi:hypothetical protein N7486_001935 [Penicillium sp. IBT 16267x]|nr:hypothetical protein N7486_001935 [Penicillium sp. IBT 16267x]